MHQFRHLYVTASIMLTVLVGLLLCPHLIQCELASLPTTTTASSTTTSTTTTTTTNKTLFDFVKGTNHDSKDFDLKHKEARCNFTNMFTGSFCVQKDFEWAAFLYLQFVFWRILVKLTSGVNFTNTCTGSFRMKKLSVTQLFHQQLCMTYFGDNLNLGPTFLMCALYHPMRPPPPKKKKSKYCEAKAKEA